VFFWPGRPSLSSLQTAFRIEVSHSDVTRLSHFKLAQHSPPPAGCFIGPDAWGATVTGEAAGRLRWFLGSKQWEG
jgi:hypothetical protein